MPLRDLVMTTSNESTSILIVVGKVTEQNCELSAKLNRSPWLIGVAMAHVFISICGLMSMYSYFKTPPIRKAVGIINANLKIVCIAGYFYYFWGFTSSMFVYFYRLYIYVSNPRSCDYIWSSACGFAYTLFHIALLVERLYATFYESNRDRWPVFGLLLALTVLVVPQYRAFVSNYAYYSEKGLIYNRIYCSSLVYSSADSNRLILNSFVKILVTDFAVTVADFCLLLYNKKQIAKYYRTVTLFFIIYLLQDTTMNPETDQLWRESVNLVRTLNNLLLFFVLCFVHRRQQTTPNDYTRDENEANHYFQQFNQMIS
ncbi:hypothetical protein M3Y96_00181500 [Aphelenchoides besseyi]|nr:hypothetical protein M3Y96_00181500 [Aphelenchoides besseyi]